MMHNTEKIRGFHLIVLIMSVSQQAILKAKIKSVKIDANFIELNITTESL